MMLWVERGCRAYYCSRDTMSFEMIMTINVLCGDMVLRFALHDVDDVLSIKKAAIGYIERQHLSLGLHVLMYKETPP